MIILKFNIFLIFLSLFISKGEKMDFLASIREDLEEKEC